MITFNTKQELRNEVLNNAKFIIEFDCGLKLHKFILSGEIKMIRDHEYNFMWSNYETQEKFINAVWAKLKRGGEISRLDIKNY